jgi:hypothetical protein
VTCFQDGQLYVVDPRGQSQVEDIITVGRGPYAVVDAIVDLAVDSKPVEHHQRLFVSNYLEDTIAVVDIEGNSPKHRNVHIAQMVGLVNIFKLDQSHDGSPVRRGQGSVARLWTIASEHLWRKRISRLVSPGFTRNCLADHDLHAL